MQRRLMAMLMTVAGASLAIAGLYAASPQDVEKQAGAPGDSQKKSDPTMPGGPGFGPGMFRRQIFEIADSDKDGRLTIEENAKAADQFIREADAEKKGSIDPVGALALALNRRMGPPGDGPGPGGPPGGFGPGLSWPPRSSRRRTPIRMAGSRRKRPSRSSNGLSARRTRRRPARSTPRPWPGS